jgi:hypothetical protein
MSGRCTNNGRMRLGRLREQQQLARDMENRYAEDRALRNQARVMVAMKDLQARCLRSAN